MGRTLPTQINLLHQAEEEWKGFRRALRREDQAFFDALWVYARRHAVAASQAERPLPLEAHFLAMLLGLKRELEEMRAQSPWNVLIQGPSKPGVKMDPGLKHARMTTPNSQEDFWGKGFSI